MSEEWGPWIDHDGNGCPVKGMWVKSETALGDVEEHIAHALLIDVPGGFEDRAADLWDYGTLLPGDWEDRIIRYRVRRPKALQKLIQMVENLPAPSKKYEEA